MSQAADEQRLKILVPSRGINIQIVIPMEKNRLDLK